MRRISKVIAGLTLAAGVFGGTAALAMGDGYNYRSPTSGYSYTQPNSYYYTQPDATYSYSSPGMNYDPQPYGSGYYDNIYNPYWSYQGPLGQGSGSDMRIGR